jgi:hypothetical protein
MIWNWTRSGDEGRNDWAQKIEKSRMGKDAYSI